MSLPCPVQIDGRLGLHDLARSGKLLFFYGGMAEALYLADAEKLPIAGKGKGTSRLARPPRSADAVYIIFCVLRKVVIDDDLHIVHIDASGRHIGGDQDIGGAVPETSHSHVPLMLRHVPVQPLHLESGLSDYLGKLVHLDLRITEYQAKSGLIILQQTDARRILILLLHPIIPLGHQRYGQLLGRHLHQSGVLLELIGDLKNGLWHGSREQRRLMGIGNLTQNQLHVLPEAHVQHLVRLVQNHHVHIVQFHGAPAHMIHYAPRRSHDDLHALQAVDLPDDILSAIYGKHLNAMHIFCDLSQLLRRLHGQLSGGTQNHRLKLLQIRIDLLQGRNTECRRLTGSGLGLSDDIVPVQKVRNCHFLNGGKLLESHFPNGPHNPLVQKGLYEGQTVRPAHSILSLS